MNRQKIFRRIFRRSAQLLVVSFFTTSVLSGCVALAPVVETVVVSSAVRISAGRAIIAGAASGSRLAPVVLGAFGVNALGEAFIVNTTEANELFSKVYLRYTKGSSPKVYYEGSSEPLFEIHTRTRQLRDFSNGELHTIPDNLFTVTVDGVEVRQGSLMSARVIDKVYKRDIVIKLAEENGWYRVSLARKPKPIEGWVKAEHLIALAILGDEDDVPSYRYPSSQNQQQQQPAYANAKPKIHDCAEMRTGDLMLVNKTDMRIAVAIYESSLPRGHVGGLTKELTLAPNEEKTLYDLPIGVYRYEAKEANPSIRATRIYEIYGEARVVMCKEVSQDIR